MCARLSVKLCVCGYFAYIVKVKETSCPPVAPDGKPSPVALPQAQSAPKEQVCSQIQKHFFFGMLLHSHSLLSLSKVDNHSNFVCIIDFTSWLPNCNRYPTVGPRADSLWGGLQAREEDLRCQWQWCNFSLFVTLCGLHLPCFTKALPCLPAWVDCLLLNIEGNVSKSDPGLRLSQAVCR